MDDKIFRSMSFSRLEACIPRVVLSVSRFATSVARVASSYLISRLEAGAIGAARQLRCRTARFTLARRSFVSTYHPLLAGTRAIPQERYRLWFSYLQAFRDVNKRTASLVCNVPLLQAGVAPLSFLDMDKTAYVKGLLAFNELNRPDLIADAFAEAYEKSAARYDAYAGRPKAVLDIEFRRRNDIFGAVKAYVAAIGNSEQPGSFEEFARQHFPDDDGQTQELLADRVREIIESLNDANHIAYGVSRQEICRVRSGFPAAGNAGSLRRASGYDYPSASIQCTYPIASPLNWASPAITGGISSACHILPTMDRYCSAPEDRRSLS
ncbi:hypothetical protein JQ594_17625 [Bradyrhizobium manausense]|uniref:hypothetical protein n=1 Tax=Bradyrhizobium manausense TaxID=989370 RepID=UPI001BAD591F|nr:hypothetical protein [Bradyrhizobium manausense]MBR0687755.1 hypothetical protein [Bradyrhizobium manausense]